MDNLTYTYTGNKLYKVEDAISGDNIVDFVNRNAVTNDYDYYSDGSLKKDLNKEISQIDYDPYLKLPKQISLTNNRWIKITYAGDGRVLKRTYSTGEYWEYDGSMVYKNGQPYQLSTPEGRATYVSNAWFYEYNIKDHLGNVRVSFKSNSGVLQQVESTNYDPFGIELNGTGTANSVENRFKYQDKESLTLFGLSGINDFGARYYDKTVGRWWGVDALADVSRRHSPYQYNYNNPLRYIDPDGMASEEMVGADGLTNSQWLAAGGDAGKEKTFNQENKKEEKSTQKNTIQIYNRDDGGQNSKLFSNETEAYRYMWAIALLKKWGIRGREVGAILTNKGVLVTPYANNEYADSGSGFLEAGLKKNNDYISFEGGQLFMLGVIHTHQALSLDGSPWALGYKLSGEDKDFAYKMIPGKPIFAIGRDGNLYGYAWANYGKKIMKGDEGFWTGHNTAELFDGSFRLIPSLKQIFNKP